MNTKKILNLKAVVNKRNNQINFSLSRKKAPKELIDKADSGKIIKFLFEDS